MIELQMVRRMVARGAILSPAPIALMWFFHGPEWALSCAVGLALALGNLWVQGRVIGGVAESNPSLLPATALTAFALSLVSLTAIGFALRGIQAFSVVVMGLTLVAAHLVLVLWEGVHALAPLGKSDSPDAVEARS